MEPPQDLRHGLQKTNPEIAATDVDQFMGQKRLKFRG
jgi:hypothetical protein